MLFEHELAWKDPAVYNEVYKNSIEHPEEFWNYHRHRLFPSECFNAAYNCVDRHAQANPDKTAIIWYGDEYCEYRRISYRQLQIMTQKIASELVRHNVKKGDSITIYAAICPESIAAMLACCRIGAMHNVIFSGFSAATLRERCEESKIVLTMSHASRNGRSMSPLKTVLEAVGSSKSVILLDHVDDFPIEDSCLSYENVNYYDNMFTLYTSGSTKAPKKICHCCGGYLLYTAMTFKNIFDVRENDVHFCTSDIGWITGHSYIVYAPLFFGLTTVIFQGVPTYPTVGRYWEIIEREKVTIFYSAPTAIRCLATVGGSQLDQYDFSSLRMLGSVGEPMDEAAWNWFFTHIGQGRCPIADTWWQTETGGIILAPLCNLEQKPGFASKPFFGIVPKIVNDELVIQEKNWPGLSVNFSREDGQCYHTGDKAMQDADGDIKILGRIDDVINVSGHRIGTSELESIINSLGEIEECAVVGVPHRIKGQTIFVFATTTTELNQSQKESVFQEIIARTREEIGAIAKPEKAAFVPALPKTRSGKIKRNILKTIGAREDINYDSADFSSIVNPECIQEIEKITRLSTIKV